MTTAAYIYSPETRDYIVYGPDGELVGVRFTALAAQTLHDEHSYRQALTAAGSPAIDVAGLAEMMRADPDLAYAQLAQLSAQQIVVEATAYAAYANELLGLDLSAQDVLEFWWKRLAARGLAK